MRKKCWCSHTQADSCVSERTTYRSMPRGVRHLIPEVDTGGCHVHYQAHVENIGWLPGVSDGQIAGTTGQGRQMEARCVWRDCGHTWHVIYQGHMGEVVWPPEVADGEVAGTTGQRRRLEAVRIGTQFIPGGV